MAGFFCAHVIFLSFSATLLLGGRSFSSLHILVPMLLYILDFYALDRARTIGGSFDHAVREEFT